jgi:hypothetical protein
VPEQPDANDILMGGGGAKPAAFGQDGVTIGGRIVSTPKSYHVRAYDRDNPGNGPLQFYPSGDPIMGVRVDVQTNDRDPLDPTDDGVRRLYLDRKRQLSAVREAVRAAGADGLQVGGYLTLTRTGTEQGEGAIPAVTFAAVYRGPSVAVPGAPASTPAPAPQAQAPAYSAPPQPMHQAGGVGQPRVTPDLWAAQPAAVQQQPGVTSPQVHPAAPTAPQQQPQQQPPQPQQQQPAPAAPQPQQGYTIPESVAAVMRQSGIDTSAYTITPG